MKTDSIQNDKHEMIILLNDLNPKKIDNIGMDWNASRYYRPNLFFKSINIQKYIDLKVDIACRNKKKKISFSGDIQLRENVELKFGDFLNFYQSTYDQSFHWTREIKDLDFYLCQTSILSFDGNHSVFPALINDIKIPKLLDEQHLTQINLWINVEESHSNLHYDSYHNLLVVLYGCKKIDLFPPSSIHKLHSNPIYFKTPNHSSFNDTFQDNVSTKQTFLLKENEAIYIPEGWWHQVSSNPFTVAINFWFDGFRNKIIQNPTMYSYYSRILMEKMISEKKKEKINQLKQTIQKNTKAKPLWMLEKPEYIIGKLLLEDNKFQMLNNIILFINSVMLIELTILLAKDYPTIWIDFLNHSRPEIIDYLTTCWEESVENDLPESLNMNEYYTILFNPFGSKQQEIKDKMMIKNDLYNKLCCKETILDVFGLDI